MISCVWIDCTRTPREIQVSAFRGNAFTFGASSHAIFESSPERDHERCAVLRSVLIKTILRSMVCARASAVELVSGRRPCKRRTIDVSWRGRSQIHSAVAAFSSEGRGDLARWRPTRSRTGTSPRKRVRPRGQREDRHCELDVSAETNPPVRRRSRELGVGHRRSDRTHRMRSRRGATANPAPPFRPSARLAPSELLSSLAKLVDHGIAQVES